MEILQKMIGFMYEILDMVEPAGFALCHLWCRSMNQAAVIAILFSIGLMLFGGITAWYQRRGLHRLRERKHVPSDELAYFTGRYRRRTATGLVLFCIGVLIGLAFISGMEERARRLGEHQQGVERPGELGGKEKAIRDEDRDFLRFWGGYWIVVLLLVFVVLGLAFQDAWSTRRYWMSQYAQIREDHHTKLRRDLAVYRQQKQGRGRNRMSGTMDDTSTD